ncbi:MAG TPA: hypothetical protein VEC06_20085 [Paucimonas sp.]|nr:hypothetical protein [Paucimonas sp.]
MIRNSEYRKHLYWGGMLVLTGGLFLLARIGLFEEREVWRFWPILVAWGGLIDIVGARGAREAAMGVFHIVIAFWLYACIEHLWGWTFKTTWPIILIAYGVAAVVSGSINLYQQSRKESAQ